MKQNIRANLRLMNTKSENKNEEFSFTKNKTNFDNYQNFSSMKQNVSNSLIANSHSFEEENVKIQKEAKELIHKTRKMMENLDMDKLKMNKAKSNNLNESILCNSTRSLKDRSHSRKKKFANSFEKFERECHTQIVDNEVHMKNHINLNLKNMNNRLMEKTKIIKNLERELREKNANISKLQEKLEQKNEEILRLNEALIVNYYNL